MKEIFIAMKVDVWGSLHTQVGCALCMCDQVSDLSNPRRKSNVSSAMSIHRKRSKYFDLVLSAEKVWRFTLMGFKA